MKVFFLLEGLINKETQFYRSLVLREIPLIIPDSIYHINSKNDKLIEFDKSFMLWKI